MFILTQVVQTQFKHFFHGDVTKIFTVVGLHGAITKKDKLLPVTKSS